MWARTSSQRTHELAATDSDEIRLRFGVNGGLTVVAPASGATPKPETGMRHDGDGRGHRSAVDPGDARNEDLDGAVQSCHVPSKACDNSLSRDRHTTRTAAYHAVGPLQQPPVVSWTST